MTNDDLERRIEDLESDIAVLKEALLSATEWKAEVSHIRVRESGNLSGRITGQDKTRDILEQLP
jgi:hypothetical protein